MGQIKPGQYSHPQPQNGYTTLIECVVAFGTYVPGDQIYYLDYYAGVASGNWKVVNKNTCRQSKEYLDSQYSGKTAGFPMPESPYLLQVINKDFVVGSVKYGDRVWHFTYPGEVPMINDNWGKDWILVDVYKAPDAG